MTFRFKQCFNSIIFKYFIYQCPNFLNEVFDVTMENNFQIKISFQEIKCHFCKTNTGQFAFSYIGLTFWSKILDTAKRSNNLNTFKHNFQKISYISLKILITLLDLFSFSAITIFNFIYSF